MGILNELRKRAIVAIAEPVAVAVAAAVEQTLRANSERVESAVAAAFGEQAFSEETKRQLVDDAACAEACAVIADALAGLAGKVVGDFEFAIKNQSLTPDMVAQLRKLDQLADQHREARFKP